jgi:hypothetical protein
VGYGLDGQSTPGGAYSLRRLLSSYTTNKLVRLVRASDSATSEIGFTATGAIDTATATTFCAATTCKVSVWYDQSGSGRDLLQGTDSARPLFVFNCLGANPCVQFLSNAVALTGAASVTPATGVVSLSTVANRVSGANPMTFIRMNGSNNRMAAPATASTWQIVGGGGGVLTGVSSDGAWHSAVGVINGASSALSINGVRTTGTTTGNTTAGQPAIAGALSSTVDVNESIFWDNVALSPAVAAAITANQRAWWGF